MNLPTWQQIKDYYPTYLLAHQNVWNRRLHVVGNLMTLLYVGCLGYGMAFHSFWYMMGIPLTPFIVYPFAWTGHRYMELNKPATWSINPIQTKACDWIMMYDIISGKIKL